MENLTITQIESDLDGLVLGVSYGINSGTVEQIRYNDKVIIQVNNGGYEKASVRVNLGEFDATPEMVKHVENFLYGQNITELLDNGIATLVRDHYNNATDLGECMRIPFTPDYDAPTMADLIKSA